MSNIWLSRKVIGYGHQGGAHEAPASTIFAMENALSLGLGGLELDLHRTADGVLVVLHDESVDRTTSRKGFISAFLWDELATFDNAYWFVPELDDDAPFDLPDERYVYRGKAPLDPRFGIARFRDILTAFPAMIINVDIKDASLIPGSVESQVVHEIVDLKAEDRVMVASFKDSSLLAVRSENEDVATSAGPGEISEFYFALLSSPDQAVEIASGSPYVAFQIPRYYGELELATTEFIDAAHAGGKAVHVWTVNDEHEMNLLIERGVDGIISDCPSVLAKSLENSQCSFRL